ncbi:5260_t:CDS:1, partial [Dentiscutata heterogama]
TTAATKITSKPSKKSKQTPPERANALTPSKRKLTSIEMGKSKNKKAKTQGTGSEKEQKDNVTHTTEE